MRQVLAIARLTLWEGIRMRIVLVLLMMLAFVVLLLPTALKGDGTLAGRLQTFMAYSLGAVNVLLCLTTIFFSCTTLTAEVRSRSLHLVVTKPVTRFQILMGKWLGVNLLTGGMLLLCGLVIYVFAVSIKNQPVRFARDEVNIRDVIWTARLGASPAEPDFMEPARERVRDRVAKEGAVFREGEEAAAMEFARQYREEWLRIPAGQERLYEFEDLLPPETEQTAFQVRYKVRALPPPPEEQVPLLWLFLDVDTKAPLMPVPLDTLGRSGDTLQFLVRAQRMVRDGRAAVVIANPAPPQRPYTVYFEGREGLQLLYRVGSFEVNYGKTLLLILFRLAFLSALGLFFSTFASFPVASFCVASIFAFCLLASWFLEAMGANLELRTDAVDPYWKFGPAIRTVLEPLFRYAFPDFLRYDGVGRLIDGMYVSNWLLVAAALHTLLYGSLLLSTAGWSIFRSREVAAVQV